MRFIHHSISFFFRIVLFVMLMTTVSVVCKKICIISSPDQPCPDASTEQVCLTLASSPGPLFGPGDEASLTLQQFASNSSSGASVSSKLIIVLELLPGFHSLQTSISVVSVYIQTLKIIVGSDATVQCSGSLSSMEFPNVQLVKISALIFTNCGRGDFLQCEQCHC